MFDLTKGLNMPGDKKTKAKDGGYKIVGSTRLKRGHTLFRYDKETGELCKQETLRQADVITKFGVAASNKRVNIAQGCVYLGALNFKNAVKKLKKMGHTKNITIIKSKA